MEQLRETLELYAGYRRVIAVDRYDQRAHKGLIDALTNLGATKQASDARGTYVNRMAELGISSF